MTTTTDFSEFGNRELFMASELLKNASENNLPKDFDNDGIQIMFNKHSGNVFLTNSEFQVAMINDISQQLESFYSCPTCGHEGFFEDMDHSDDDDECTAYYQELREVQ